MNGLADEQSACPGHELAGVAVILAKPIFEHLVDCSALPRRTVICIDRVDAASAENFLRIEGEWISLQSIYGRDRNLLGPLVE